MKLTMAQLYTLRRISNGTKYVLRADGKKSHEQRQEGRFTTHPVNAPSIPPLFRLGLVKFESECKRESGRYYSVEIARNGYRVLRENKERSE